VTGKDRSQSIVGRDIILEVRFHSRVSDVTVIKEKGEKDIDTVSQHIDITIP